MKPSSVSCPSCQAVAFRHCQSTNCSWFRCARCRSYGPYQNLAVGAWSEYQSVMPLEMLYEMASIEIDQRVPLHPDLRTGADG